MFESFNRALDRELGPETGADGSSPVRDPWRRDWPLLVGLVASAGLIGASTTLAGDSGRSPVRVATPPKAASAGVGITGEPVDVGEDQTAHTGESGKSASSKKKTGEKAAPSESAPAEADEGGSTASPSQSSGSSEAGAGAGTGSGSASRGRRAGGPSRRGGSTGGGGMRTGRIVNVTGTSATLTNGAVSYAFSAPTHTPKVGKDWVLKVSAARSGAPLQGNVKIDILHNGAVVGHAASGKLKGGRFAHDFDWPERSVGHPLTVKTTVVAGGYQQSFLFAVRVKSAG